MKISRLFIILIAAGILLPIPLIAMQFTSEVEWSFFDFLIMGILLIVTGLGIELALRLVPSTKNRIIICGFFLGAFFLIWAEFAVGIFGTPFAGS